MSAIQDAIADNREKIEKVVAPVLEEVKPDASPQPPAAEEFDAEQIDALLGSLVELRVQMVASEDEDMTLLKRRQEYLAAEVQLRKFYTELPAVKELLGQKRAALAEAESIGYAPEVAVRRLHVEKLASALEAAGKQVVALNVRYPDLAQKIEDEQATLMRYREFLSRFAKGDGLYVAKETLNPLHTSVPRALAFFAVAVEDALCQGLIVPAECPEALLKDREGHGFAPVSAIPEGALVCRVLAEYYQKVLEHQASEYAHAGLLLAPEMVACQKKDPQNRRNVAHLIREKSGFCFVEIHPWPQELLIGYRHLAAEMRVEYLATTGNKEHGMRVTAVTTPCVVDDFFPFVNRERRRPAYYFDDLSDMTRWTQINPLIKSSLVTAIRRNEAIEKEYAVLEKLANPNRLGDRARTIDELADGEQGTAIVLVPYFENRYTLGMEIVSDGAVLRPGLATKRSEGSELYGALKDGSPVSEFLARYPDDGTYVSAGFQAIYVQNERKELERMAPVLARRYGATRISRSHDNIRGLTMPMGQGGENGVYLFFTFVWTVTHASGEVGYVVRREDDKIVFVNGVTAYSRQRLGREKVSLDVPYALCELHGFVSYLLQRVYRAVVKDCSYEDLPEHLKSGKARAQAEAQDAEENASV